MNILVTGAAGFIGSHLCEALSQNEADQIFCLDNFNDFYDPEIKRRNIRDLIELNQVTLFETDLRDYDQLKSIFETYSFDIIIHLAAMAGVRPSIEQPFLYTQVNIIGTQHLLDLSKDFNVPHFIFGSSSSVYGENKKVPFSEDDFVDHPISPYAATKKTSELLCHTYHHLYKLNIACLRFFTVYGPRQRPDLAIHKFTRLINEGIAIPLFGDGTTKRDYTYVDDIVDGTIRTMTWLLAQTDPAYMIFNIGESQTVELNYLVSLIEKALNKKAIIKHLPHQPGDVPLTYASIDKSRKFLGYDPKTKIEEGIPIFVKWFLESNNL
ncbi:MAG TPA: NAD-dependent epimerase/dehydratase family protein [Spirochaetes bacterium]|nr:NAD-dependent epimerase/dehydratase family protein [Spirochaetota bacterium]